jgi:hypothetical protein
MMADKMTVSEIASRIEADLPPLGEGAKYEGFAAGAGSKIVQGILVANIPNVAALRRPRLLNATLSSPARIPISSKAALQTVETSKS